MRKSLRIFFFFFWEKNRSCLKEEGRPRSPVSLTRFDSFARGIWKTAFRLAAVSSFLRPLLRKSLLLAIRPPSRTLHRPSTDQPQRLFARFASCARANEATMRLRVAFTFSTRFFHPFSSSLSSRNALATSYLQPLQIFLFNHSYLPLVVIYLFNIYFQSTSSMASSLVSIDLSRSIVRMECSYYRSTGGKKSRGTVERKDPFLASYPISTSHALSTILTRRSSGRITIWKW